jgi:signal transduction histidine kinase
MVRAFFAPSSGSSRGERSDRASIILPFLVVSIGLGVLAWRSWVLSGHMETGVDTLARASANYSSEIIARRVDNAVGVELAKAAEEWQKVERRMTTPTAESLRGWIGDYDWIVSAIYMPDADPTNAIYVNDSQPSGPKAVRLSKDFLTTSGSVRYTLDPIRLLAHARSAMRQPSLERGHDPRQQVLISLIPAPSKHGVVSELKGEENGFAYVAPLAAPLTGYAIRSFVPAGYDGTSFWQNPRVISTLASLLAVLLTALGAYLALRGHRREAETMQLRGALIANVSHELRTPLSMIRLGAETLKRGGTRLREKDRHDIEDQILHEVLHLSHLVENVLDVARIQNRSTKALSFQPVYPRELVTSLLATYDSWISSKGFSLTVNIDEAVDEQLWDRDAVSRSVLNLIDNAIKYSSDDKQLAVTLRQTPADVIIEVKDRGIGIAADDLQRIFDPYYRATFSDTQTRRGAGLGLTLVEQIMISHGGRVEVESQPGKGSTFRLIFPRPKTQTAHGSVPSLAPAS